MGTHDVDTLARHALNALTRDVKIRGYFLDPFQKCKDRAFESLLPNFRQLGLNENLCAMQRTFAKVHALKHGFNRPNSSQRRPG